MAFIQKEEVAQVRANLKAAFGRRFKFSVRRVDYSTVDVAIVEGDIENWADYMIDANEYRLEDAARGKIDINHYWIEENWKGEAKEIFSKILECCQVGEGSYNRNAGDPSADYGDMTYFIDISVGRWNKPYICKAGSEAKAA